MSSYGLPSHYYTDPAILRREQSMLFGRMWQIVGREGDVLAAGSFLTCVVAGEPVIVARGEGGELHAFSNVCAHRGMRLADGAGTCKRFVCPYHGWTYDPTGRLVAVPLARYLPDDFDRTRIQLARAKVGTWGGFVFVNLDPAAESLASYLGDMVKRWEDYGTDWPELRVVRRITYDEPFNWKIFMENSTDYYHIPFIHRETLALPPVFRNRSAGLHFMLTAVTPDEGYDRYFDLVFPNSYFHIGPSKIQHFQVSPRTPGESAIEIVLYQTPVQMERFPLNDPTKHLDVDRILAEDFAICRALQQQATSQYFRVRYTADQLEEGVNHFDRTLLTMLRVLDGDVMG